MIPTDTDVYVKSDLIDFLVEEAGVPLEWIQERSRMIPVERHQWFLRKDRTFRTTSFVYICDVEELYGWVEFSPESLGNGSFADQVRRFGDLMYESWADHQEEHGEDAEYEPDYILMGRYQVEEEIEVEWI